MMPDSPSIKPLHTSPPMALHPSTRPLSASIPTPGLNGGHSPHINGQSPAHLTSSANQHLPPACGARQLSKLKRFLTTLQQFGSDISPEIGERVRSLVLALVNNHVSIEEFHSKLQEATNFPLRPFVIPFLKANLPLLQRELLHCARIAKLSPQHYLQQNDHFLHNSSHLSPSSSIPSVASEFNENGKRPSPDRPQENDVDSHMLSPHPPKRSYPLSPVSSTITQSTHNNLPYRSDDTISAQRDRFFKLPYSSSRDILEPFERVEDDWKHVESLLQCIVGMVDKAKRTVNILQERSIKDRDDLSQWMRRNTDGLDSDLKKRHDEIIALNIRQTEERVADVKRRAEEAVNEVKRQAMSELQKAVSASEQKANELVNIERVKMEKIISEARKAAHEEAMTTLNQQSDSRTNCWNCGRKANETCSGCNVARYCGSFCQHKDWENHHIVCGKSAVMQNHIKSGTIFSGLSNLTKQHGFNDKPKGIPSSTITSDGDMKSQIIQNLENTDKSTKLTTIEGSADKTLPSPKISDESVKNLSRYSPDPLNATRNSPTDINTNTRLASVSSMATVTASTLSNSSVDRFSQINTDIVNN